MKGSEMGETYSTHKTDEKCVQNCSPKNLEGRDRLGDLGNYQLLKKDSAPWSQSVSYI